MIFFIFWWYNWGNIVKNGGFYIMNKVKEKNRDSIWGFLGVLLVVFVVAGVCLTIQQNELNGLNSDSNDIEYLSSSTQRLVRMLLSDQHDQKLLSYLDEQSNILLNQGTENSLTVLGDKDFSKLADDILYYWDNIVLLIDAEELDHNTLLLAADNHFYHMTILSDMINEYSEILSKEIATTQGFISIIILIFAIVIINNVLSYRAELRNKKILAERALIDTATGLYNRSKCQELFKASSNKSAGNQTAIIVFDLNDLKKANDVYGHRVGDELIRTFAKLLTQASKVHKIPPFIGRYGGDEFIVYYEDVNSMEELQIFLKELEFLSKEQNEKEKRFQISYAHGCSITANTESDCLNARQLFDIADENMYENKKEIKAKNASTAESTNVHTATEFIPDTAPSLAEEDEQETEEIPQNEEADIIKAERNSSKKMIAAALSIVILFNVVSQVNKNSNLDYIGGNVFNLPIGSGLDSQIVQAIGNPWNNSSISALLTFRGLFLPNTTFTDVVPDLATKYEILDDGLTYVITFSEGEKWSDGTPITLEDVVFSFESFLLCEGGNVNLSTAFNKIVGADELKNGKAESLSGLEVNGNELTIRLTSKHNTFVLMLAEFVPLPKHILSQTDMKQMMSNTEFYEAPVCSGMYMVDGLDANNNIVLTRNPHYSGETSDIETVVLNWDYLNEDIDYYSTSNISQMVSYRAMRGFDEYNVDVFFYRYFVFNLNGGYEAKTVAQLKAEQENPVDPDEATEKPITKYDENRPTNTPIEDPLLRQAIIHAIDTEQLLNDLYFNTGILTHTGAPTLYNEEIHEYNPAKARELLAKSGYDTDRVFTIAYYHSDKTTYVFLQQVAEYLSEIGLTVEMVKSTGNEFMYETREFDMVLKGLSSYNTEDWYSEFLSTNGNMSALMGKSGEFDSLVQVLSSTTDEATYQETLQKLVALEQQLNHKFPLFTLNESIYINSNRLEVPQDIIYTNTRYRTDLRFSEWKIKKS